MRRISEQVGWERFDPAGEDAHGNTSRAWLPAVELGIYAYNPGGTVEPLLAGHDRVILTPTVYLPSTPIPGPHDRLVVRGERFEVEGVTLDFRSPFNSSMNGCSVALKLVEG